MFDVEAMLLYPRPQVDCSNVVVVNRTAGRNADKLNWIELYKFFVIFA
jgi:hypothetical protein